MDYNSKSYDLAVERSSKLEEQTEHYKYGFEAGSLINCNQHFKEKFGEPVGGSKEWIDYLNGERDKKYLIAHEKYKEYKLDEFKEKIDKLCEEYGVIISFGCGCCGAGFQCKDLEIYESVSDHDE